MVGGGGADEIEYIFVLMYVYRQALLCWRGRCNGNDVSLVIIYGFT